MIVAIEDKIYAIFLKQRMVYASLRPNSGLRTGFVGEPYICLYIVTIIQSMLESDDAFSSDSSTKSYTDQKNLRGVGLPI
jgi:hypothetical protein